MHYGSLFSGVGGFDLGLDKTGMVGWWQVEIDDKCRSVLANHWPNTERFTDVKECGRHNLKQVDLICGGFPCQDVSIAGARAGLAGERSGLWYEFQRILAELKPRWVLIENVPGLLSSKSGGDFATVLQGLEELGYLGAWRTLNSRYFGVPQQRRRVFIVGYLGDGRATEVLFERKSGAWDTPPGREAQEKATGDVVSSLRSGGRGGIPGPGSGAGWIVPVARCLSSRNQRIDFETETFVPVAIDVRNLKLHPDEQSGTLQAKASGGYSLNYTNPVIVGAITGKVERPDDNSAQANHLLWEACHANEAARITPDQNATPTLQGRMGTGGNNVPMIRVRRLTPAECCRLQGFPDDWNAMVSDSQRYKQMGNAVTVNVIEWIGRRIIEIDSRRELCC